jgi:hypothetical protein
MAWLRVKFLATCDILEAGFYYFADFCTDMGPYKSQNVFYRNVDRNTRADEQFNALMHGVHFHRSVYMDCPIALGQGSKAIGSKLCASELNDVF